jgi:predicted acetyltransferase
VFGLKDTLVSIRLVEKEELTLLEDLMSLYLMELSAYAKEPLLNSSGNYVYEGLEYYFIEKELFPYFILSGQEIAGFVLVNTGSYVSLAVNFSIHEFYISAEYRKKGTGLAAVQRIFELYKGCCKIEQLRENVPAIEFWRAVYRRSGIAYNEMVERSNGEEYVIQLFNCDWLNGNKH